MIPRQTMLIDIYAALRQNSQHKDAVNAFLRFLKSYRRRTILGQNGYRPVNKKALAQFAKQFPVRPGETHDQRQADRRLARGRQEVVRPEQQHHGRRSRSRSGVSTAG